MIGLVGAFALFAVVSLFALVYLLSFPITWAILAVAGMVWMIYVGIIGWFTAALVLGIFGCLMKATIEHDKSVK